MNALRIALFAAIASLSLGGPALAKPALAQPTLGQDDDERPRRGAVSREQAIEIARGYGIVRFEDVEQDDGGWEIEGIDRRGREVEITINRQGRVTRVERNDDDDDDD